MLRRNATVENSNLVFMHTHSSSDIASKPSVIMKSLDGCHNGMQRLAKGGRHHGIVAHAAAMFTQAAMIAAYRENEDDYTIFREICIIYADLKGAPLTWVEMVPFFTNFFTQGSWYSRIREENEHSSNPWYLHVPILDRVDTLLPVEEEALFSLFRKQLAQGDAPAAARLLLANQETLVAYATADCTRWSEIEKISAYFQLLREKESQLSKDLQRKLESLRVSFGKTLFYTTVLQSMTCSTLLLRFLSERQYELLVSRIPLDDEYDLRRQWEERRY